MFIKFDSFCYYYKVGKEYIKALDNVNLYQLFLTSKSHLRLARSTDGIHFLIDDKPFLSSQFFYEEYGIEDPRITFVDDWYYIDYSATSRHGVFTCLHVLKILYP